MDRFDEVVGGAEIEPSGDAMGMGGAGEPKDGGTPRAGVGVESLQRGDAQAVGLIGVEEDEIGGMMLRQPEAGGEVVGVEDAGGEDRQPGASKAAPAFGVVDDEKLCGATWGVRDERAGVVVDRARELPRGLGPGREPKLGVWKWSIHVQPRLERSRSEKCKTVRSSADGRHPL